MEKPGTGSPSSTPAASTAVLRREGADKLTGAARYVDDLQPEGVWLGATIRSPHPHARILGIHLDPDFDWSDVCVVTARDLPGPNVIHLIIDDQPCLADGVTRHREEPVALVACADRDRLLAARAAITVEYEPLPAILDYTRALDAEEPIFGTDNVFKDIHIVKGDAAGALDRAARVVEGEYFTPHQEQLYIENQGMLARWTAGDRVEVTGSLQCPWYVVGALGKLFGIPGDHVRVIQATTGGGFGGKEEYPNILAAHAALLARKSGHPVKMVYDRIEDLAATTKRHPSRVRHRSGIDAEGRIVAMEVDVLMDGGAYCTLSPVVLSRGAIHAAGPYRCENVDIRARVVATHTPPNGAFRGFGAPQTVFALEAHMDRVAEAAGLDPVAFRRLNVLAPHQTLATGQEVGDDVSAREALETAVSRTRFEEKRGAFDRANAAASTGAPQPWIRRGIGLSLFHHGSGFTGAGEDMLQSEAGVRVLPDGRVLVLSSQTEMGQGTRTVLAQIVAEGLGYPVDWVETRDPDTAVMPDSGPTVASRTVMVVGGILARAAARLRRESSPDPVDPDALREILRGRAAAEGTVEVRERYRRPAGLVWDDKAYRGDAYAAYGWSCQVAEVEVDLRTWETRVTAFTAVQDVGKVVHPLLAAGQVEGGVLQGIGFALYEDVIMKDGAMENRSLTNYIIPTTVDTPPIHVHFLEPRTAGIGPRGLGELPMDGPAPAVLNAVRHATGADLRTVPVLPERLREALRGSTGSKGGPLR